MKKIMLIVSCLLIVLKAEETPKGILGLSSETRALLTEEMMHVEEGMKEIFSHMVRGEYESVVKIATDIQESYIFKKRLTDIQRKELKSNLPKEFIALDRSFHESAGKMAEAAEFSEKKEVAAAFYEMSQKCVACHSQFATHRFTTFEE